VIVAKREARPTALGSGAFDVVACASSAGGLNALSELFSRLPADFQAAIAVVQHLDRRHRSLMADILSRRTRLSVKEAEAGEKLRAGELDGRPVDVLGFSREDLAAIAIGT
jgi:two-component system chemotaxis response regulator CheB